MSVDDDATVILEHDLKRANEKIEELRVELMDAQNLIDQMRYQIEDNRNLIDRWIEVFDMQLGDDGLWLFDSNQAQLWQDYSEMMDVYRKLIKDWNKFVGRYNSTVAPKDIGRPLAASEAQQADILKRRKAGASLRAIATVSGLSLRTVRTVIERNEKRDRTAKHKKELRRIEFNRQRAVAFRARMAKRKQLEKDINAQQKTAERLLKAAKGLDR